MRLLRTVLMLRKCEDIADSKTLSNEGFSAGLSGFLTISRRFLSLTAAMSIRKGVQMKTLALRDHKLQGLLTKPDKTLSPLALSQHPLPESEDEDEDEDVKGKAV